LWGFGLPPITALLKGFSADCLEAPPTAMQSPVASARLLALSIREFIARW
jgi:hypothetical protein